MRMHGDFDEAAAPVHRDRFERQRHSPALTRGPVFRMGRHRRDFQQSSRHGHPPLRAGVANVADIVTNLALHYKRTRVPADVAPPIRYACEKSSEWITITRHDVRQIPAIVLQQRSESL